MPGPWHNKMESYFPKNMTEIKFFCSSKNITNTCRRADILLNNNRTCEIQHSYISSEEIEKRFNDWNIFGKKIIWLVDGNIGIECHKLISGNYLIIFYDEWKYKSFIKMYDFILLEIDSKVFKIELKKIKCSMIELKTFNSIEKVINILKDKPEYIWDEWSDDNTIKCNLSIHQQGAGNGKTYGIWKSIAETIDKNTYIILTKQHSAKNVIYQELIDQTERHEYHIENITEKIEENTSSHFVIKYIHKKTDRECIVIIGTIDSFCYNLSGSNNSCDNFFEGILHNIKKNGMSKVSANGYMRFGGQTFPLNKQSEIWIDEAQDLPNSYLYAMAKLMLDTNCDIHIVGDKLQTLEFEDNFLNSIIKENGLIENITLKINEPININRRIKVNGMRKEINLLIDFNKYELPKIECNNEYDNIDKPTIEIIQTKQIYTNGTNNKNSTNMSIINNLIDEVILKKIDYEIKNNNYTPNNFMFIFPIMKNNILASELQTKLSQYWINKFNDSEYIQSINNSYWKNYKHDEYTQYVYLHKHTEGSCINTNDSINASRIMSIKSSKGDGREVVFILDVTERSLKIVSDKKIGLVYDSHLHVALTRAKCKNYFVLEQNNDKIHKLFGKCGYIEHFPTITNRLKIDKIYDNIDKKKIIKIMELNNVKIDDFIEKTNKNNEVKEQVDWGYHCIKYYTYYYNCILCIVNKRYDNVDFNKSELSYILDKISNLPIKQVEPREFYEYLHKLNNSDSKKNKLKHFPLCNLSDKPNYKEYFIKIQNAIEKIKKCIKDTFLDLNMYESIILMYMITLYKNKQLVDITPIDLYNITDFFKNNSKECKLLSMLNNINDLVNTVLVNVDIKTKWNVEKHINLNGNSDDFKIHENIPILGNDEKNITHIMLKSEINSLNFWDIMINTLLERFLIYNPTHEKDIEKYKNKILNTYIFVLNTNNYKKIDWTWDNESSLEIKKEIKKAIIIHFSDKHEEIYNYFCFIKNEGIRFGKDKIYRTPFQYIYEEMNKSINYPKYIIRLFEELHELLINHDKEKVKNICDNFISFNETLIKKLEISCDNYLGISENIDYEF
jgi:hypothetical protein